MPQNVHSTSDTPQDWVAFWNRPNAIYANRRNLEAHFACLLRDLETYLPEGGTVLDFGCGDALAAEAMAARCGTLYLYDAAPAVRQRLQDRFHNHPRIKVLDEDSLGSLPAGSIDLILAVSVLQYIPREDLRGLMHRWRGLLRPEGHALIADVVDPHTPMLQDIASQLRMAHQHGFLLAALLGLGRLAFSDYRRIRREAGFSAYTPAELIDVLEAAGLSAAPLPRNVGPTPHRRSFLARPTDRKAAVQSADEPALKVQ
ncbi:class I SAM-dependent methyltransferase [Azospirillum soli]|uniref:class I SAM-dependent methyltransferase n=1 Tax=Azospirillum soli TaxID=1304799 RepID=UPI0031B8399A|nr:SAM-dependent methyltransferase [Azospirillum soli]